MRDETHRPNRSKMICAVLTLGLCWGRVSAGDVVTFVGSGCSLNLLVQDISENLITAIVKRTEIDRLRIGFSSEELCSDSLFIKNCTDEIKVKVVNMSEQSVVLVFPKDIVATLETEALPNTFNDTSWKLNKNLRLKNAPVERDNELVSLSGEVAQLARELKTFKAQAEEKERTGRADLEGVVFGRLRGSMMLTSGKGFAGCAVKVRRLHTSSLPFIGRKDDVESMVFTATTNEEGVFRFERLPEGSYDIYWIPPRKSYWVRLLKEDPAFVIHAGGETNLPVIKADMRILVQ